MLAVWAAIFAGVAVLLVEGSIYYYKTDRAPQWLKERKLLQVFISGACSFGIMVGIVLMMQFLVAFNKQHFTFVQAAVFLAIVAVTVVGARAIRKLERRLPPQPADN